MRADLAEREGDKTVWRAVEEAGRPLDAAVLNAGRSASTTARSPRWTCSQWLFPGRQPGQPINPVSLQVHLREIGVPPQRGRTSAIRQLVLQAPAPVIAKALGYHDKTATRLGTEAGGTWSRYAPGDHQR